jgi:hypothetical protein
MHKGMLYVAATIFIWSGWPALTAYARGAGGHAASHSSFASSHSVRAYVRSNGTYVAPHHATNPNGTRTDNWSTRGNINPYTGKAGTKPLSILPPRQ